MDSNLSCYDVVIYWYSTKFSDLVTHAESISLKSLKTFIEPAVLTESRNSRVLSDWKGSKCFFIQGEITMGTLLFINWCGSMSLNGFVKVQQFWPKSMLSFNLRQTILRRQKSISDLKIAYLPASYFCAPVPDHEIQQNVPWIHLIINVLFNPIKFFDVL